jgi:thioredoxin 1
MKKLVIYLSIIVVLFGGLYALEQANGGSSDNPYGIKEKDLLASTRKQLNDPNYQNIILPDEMKSFIEGKGTGFVYFFSPECSHCIATTPRLMPVVNEQDVDLKQFNLLEFRDGWNDYRIESTPALVYYKDGVEVERMVGGMEVKTGDGGYPKQMIEDFFKEHKAN